MWLNNIGMIQYYDNFIEHGFGDVMEPLFDLDKNDLEDMGIKMVAHKKMILRQIEKNKQQIMKKEDFNEGNVGAAVVGSTNDGDSSDGDDLFETSGKTMNVTVEQTNIENVNDSEGGSNSDDDDLNAIYDKKNITKQHNESKK